MRAGDPGASSNRGRLPNQAVALNGEIMLETMIVILLVLWLLGVVSSYTMGGVIHVLLVVAVVILLLRVIRGRRAL